MTGQTYYLVRFNSLNPQEDYQHFLTSLSSRNGIILEKGDNQVKIRYEQRGFKANFILTSSPTTIVGGSGANMMLQCEGEDDISPALFRHEAEKLEYRLYSLELGSFLPIDPDLLLASSQLTFNEKMSEIFNTKGFVPVFGNLNSLYAKNISDGSIHIINIALLEYFLQYGVEQNPTPEFSYKVATNLNKFVALYDENLIPLHFYSKYNKPLKIFNYSNFDIENIDRKVFIQPILYSYNEVKQAFEIATSEKSAFNFADKVRPGETLEQSLYRIITQDLHVADDYIRARVTSKIDFDRDKDGVLTPRLWICIYCALVNLDDDQKAKSQRGWTSLNQTKN
jgi:hypothetical protein